MNNISKEIDLSSLERLKESPGGWHSARCPLCAEEGDDRSGTNLAVSPEGKVFCHRDETHGLEVRKMLETGQRPSIRSDRGKHRSPAPRPTIKPKPTADQIANGARYAFRLAGDPDLCARIAAARGWKPETIRELALSSDLGHNGREIAFLYAHGCKLRGKRDGKRTFRWEFGGNSELWRGEWIGMSKPRRVWICEGETDAITLIDRGFEADPKASLVVALPGASTWKAEWAPMFAGREAVLVPDADEAGRRCMAKAAADLKHHAASVFEFKWEECSNAQTS